MPETEYFSTDASKTLGAVTQKGVLVLRPSFALFVPTEGEVNVLTAAGGSLLAAAAGYTLRILPSQFKDARDYVTALFGEPAATFDAHIGEVWQKAGWWYGTPADTRALFKKVPLFNRFKLGFWRGKEAVGPAFGLPGKHAPVVEPLLEAWPRM